MQLVLLYGPPAVGKFTVGSELARRTGFKLLHNHLTVNLVSAVFERDSEVWLRVLRSIRRDVLVEAARQDISLIMTGAYSGTSEHAEAWRTMLEPVRAEGGSIVFVQLTCARDELLQRVCSDSRRSLHKLVDPVRFAELMERFDLFAAAPVEPNLCLDTTLTAPEETAGRIIHQYGLAVL
jgi:shikimate kinase